MQTAVLALFGLYAAVSLLLVGVVGGEYIRQFFPGRDVLEMAGGIMLYYFLLDLLTRFFLQKFPTIAIRPYLLLPVSKARIAQYLLLRSLLSFFNFMPVFFLLPFMLIEIIPHYDGMAITGFLILVLGQTLLSNYLAFAIDKATAVNSLYAGLFLGVLLLLLYLEYIGVISIILPLAFLASTVISQPLLWIIPLALPVIAFFLLKKWFTNKLHDEKGKGSSMPVTAQFKIDWFGRFGQAGKLMDLEVRLILRSKRARSYVQASAVMALIPFYFLLDDSPPNEYMLIMVGLFVTGGFALNHGQLMLSWNSEHFDLLMSRGYTIFEIFKAKYYILTLGSVLFYVLTLPYYFIDPLIPVFNTAMLLFNCSFSVFAYMLLASYNSLRINANEGGSMSLSGFGAAHYIIGIPIFVVPVAVYFVGNILGGMSGGLFALTLVGIVGVMFHRQLIQVCTRIFMNNRYTISGAFRKQ